MGLELLVEFEQWAKAIQTIPHTNIRTEFVAIDIVLFITKTVTF